MKFEIGKKYKIKEEIFKKYTSLVKISKAVCIGFQGENGSIPMFDFYDLNNDLYMANCIFSMDDKKTEESLIEIVNKQPEDWL